MATDKWFRIITWCCLNKQLILQTTDSTETQSFQNNLYFYVGAKESCEALHRASYISHILLLSWFCQTDLHILHTLMHVAWILAPVVRFPNNVLHSGNIYTFTLGKHGNIICLLGYFALGIICWRWYCVMTWTTWNIVHAGY